MEDNNNNPNNNKRKRQESREATTVTFSRPVRLLYDLSLIIAMFLNELIAVVQLPRNKPGQEELLVFTFDVQEAADQGYVTAWAFSFTTKEENYLSVSKPQRVPFRRNTEGKVSVHVQVDLDQAGGHKKLTIYLFDFNGSLRQTPPLYLFREPTHKSKKEDLDVHNDAIKEWKKIVQNKPYLFDAIGWWQNQNEETKNQLAQEETPQVITIQPFGVSAVMPPAKTRRRTPSRITLLAPTPQSHQNLVQLNTVAIEQHASQTQTTTTMTTSSTKPRQQKRRKVAAYDDATKEELEEVDTASSWPSIADAPQNQQQMDLTYEDQRSVTPPSLLSPPMPAQAAYIPSSFYEQNAVTSSTTTGEEAMGNMFSPLGSSLFVLTPSSFTLEQTKGAASDCFSQNLHSDNGITTTPTTPTTATTTTTTTTVATFAPAVLYQVYDVDVTGGQQKMDESLVQILFFGWGGFHIRDTSCS